MGGMLREHKKRREWRERMHKKIGLQKEQNRETVKSKEKVIMKEENEL